MKAEAPTEQPFDRNGRFVVLRHLGAGGYGDVYHVRDTQTGTERALKVLRRRDSRSIYRFKQEFRKLTEIDHPNLVRLFELFVEDDTWFFTMDLVQGEELFAELRAQPIQVLTTLGTVELDTQAWGVAESGAIQRVVSDEVRSMVREQLGQLIHAVSALHAAGLVHRDLKPSNVLVTDDHRVVVLDFGLVTDTDGTRTAAEIVGSPAYLAPEVLRGEPSGPAGDWYAVGVMLYEALTGRLPFVGSASEIMRAKISFDPIAPSELARDVPRDLEHLALELLRRDPRLRPSEATLLAQFTPQRDTELATDTSRPVFVGRSDELEALSEATAMARDKPCIVFLRGAPGIGKTALARRFLGELGASEDILVVSGRCHEQELVRFNAFDSLIDELYAWLRSLPPHECAALLPRNLEALTRLFPVLGQLQAESRRLGRVGDDAGRRRTAVAALRELLGRIAERVPIALLIDDVQWTDDDSLFLLGELIAPPDPPPMLVICCERIESRRSGAFLSVVEGEATRGHVHTRIIVVDTLGETESLELASAFVGASDPRTETIVRHAGGSPLLIAELCRDDDVEGHSFEEIITRRLARLDAEGRDLVKLVCISAGPIRREVAESAAGIRTGAEELLAVLVAAHLIHIKPLRGDALLEPAHDRVRDAVNQSSTEAERRELHGRMARAIADSAAPDHEKLAVHWRGSGNRALAAQHAEIAGEEAVTALAFEHAAHLFLMASELTDGNPAHALHLRARAGDMLASAERCEQAAAVYLEAAEAAEGVMVLDLEHRAASQRLLYGDADGGLELADTVMRRMGVRIPKTDTGMLATALATYARALARERLPLPRRETLDDLERIELEVCWYAALGGGLKSTATGMFYQARTLDRSLAIGHLPSMARGAAIMLPFVAGMFGARVFRERAARAMQWAERSRDDHLRAFVLMASGWGTFLVGDFRRAFAQLDTALAAFEKGTRAVPLEIRGCRIPIQRLLWWLGDIPELAARLPLLEEHERHCENLLAEVYMRVESRAYLALVNDDTDAALQQVTDALELWGDEAQHLARNTSEVSAADVLLYADPCGSRALERVTQRWHDLGDSTVARLERVALVSYCARGRARLAAAVGASGPLGRLRRRRWLAGARSDADTMASRRLVVAPAMGGLLRAGIQAHCGDLDGALRELHMAIEGLNVHGLALYAHAARARYGQVIGGDRGQEMIREASTEMRALGVVSPARMIAMLAPGFEPL